MQNRSLISCRASRHLPFYLLPSTFCLCCCLLLAACHRGPQTAKELYDRMPRRFSGELRLQGETGTRTLAVEVLDVNVRDTRLLEFKRVRYRISGGGEDGAGEAGLAGTISAPGGEIQIEEANGAAGDALKPGTFKGKLGGDLQTMDAEWTTGFGQTVKYTGKAGG